MLTRERTAWRGAGTQFETCLEMLIDESELALCDKRNVNSEMLISLPLFRWTSETGHDCMHLFSLGGR